ncbi:hypothetical protein RND81_06G173200 [Saponaria officinalis]|uniref:Agglutinin domain-containing protein n=1 Tax=Saponaria officinalis TaxID=3572 RepID=A0AAW1K7B8_SAPOF
MANLQETAEVENMSPVNWPPYVAIRRKETSQYLAVVDSGDRAGMLEYSSSHDPQNPRAQFAIEKRFGPGAAPQDMHIRSLFNNKYWNGRDASRPAPYRATAPERVEVYGRIDCTVFRPSTSLGHPCLRYMGYNENDVCETRVSNWGPNIFLCRLEFPPFPTTVSKIDVVDVTKPMNLPRVVSFKGDNDMYLNSSREQNGLIYNIFKGSSLEDTSALYEIFPTSLQNCVRVKSHHFDRFLRRASQNWVLSNSSDESENDADTIFEVTHRGNTAVILRNIGNNRFWTRLSNDTMSDFLNTSTIDLPEPQEARLELVEPVVSRTIEIRPDNFRINEARVYNHNTFDMDHAIAPNPDNVPRVVPVFFTFTQSRSSSWNNTETIQWEGNATFRSGIPLIINEEQVAIQGEQRGPYKWGQVVDEQVERPVHRNVEVPPKTVIRLTLVAKRATSQVLFSYVQTDLLTIGSHRTYTNADGLYTGTHVYGYDINEVSEPLP